MLCRRTAPWRGRGPDCSIRSARPSRRTLTSSVDIPKQHQLSIYVHWPYCKSICPYCDFNRYIATNIDQGRMKDCLMKELKTSMGSIAQANPGSALSIGSVYFGGGTPSLAQPSTFKDILDYLKADFELPDSAEITMEANPTSVETSKLKEFRASGVNRISLGVQSLLDEDLKYLGRNHSAAEAIHSIKEAQLIFPRVSFDLIYARHPKQTPEVWSEELSRAFELRPTHLSLYTLTFEKGTPYGSNTGGNKACSLVVEVDEDLQADLYERTVKETAAYGMEQYEISNFATPGNQSLHNLNYWRYGDYLGIGPGAASRVTLGSKRLAFTRGKLPDKWMQSIETGTEQFLEHSTLSDRDILFEVIMVGLRTNEGLGVVKLAAMAKQNFDQVFSRLKPLEDRGFLTLRPTSPEAELRMYPTHQGRLVLNSLIAQAGHPSLLSKGNRATDHSDHSFGFESAQILLERPFRESYGRRTSFAERDLADPRLYAR